MVHPSVDDIDSELHIIHQCEADALDADGKLLSVLQVETQHGNGLRFSELLNHFIAELSGSTLRNLAEAYNADRTGIEL